MLRRKIMKEENPNRSLIFEYIKKKGHIVGLFVGVRIGGKVAASWSLCNKKDTFDPNMAFALCYKRLFEEKKDNVPQSIRKGLEKFRSRCARYFYGRFGNPLAINKIPEGSLFLRDYVSRIPKEVAEKWNISDHRILSSLNQYSHEKNIRKEKIGGILYAKELESCFYPTHEPVFPGIHGSVMIPSDRGPDLHFKMTQNTKPKSGKYIKIVWSVEGDE